VLDFLVGRQSDRRYLRNAILPAVARLRPARILFVGVRGYTRSYAAPFQELGSEFWTSDIDPTAARFGTPDRHVIADARRLDEDFSRDFFDVVMLNGLFGWGVDTPHDMDSVVAASAKVIAPRGMLLIGWNHDRSPDPDTLPSMGLFEPHSFAGLPAMERFADVTHCYRWYRKLA
jgi:hypothetical protein